MLVGIEMENIKYYDNIECTLTQSSKSNFIKQNSGIRFGLLGAVLFIDNNKFQWTIWIW